MTMPYSEHHQDLIGEALAVELKREDAIKETRRSLKEMSEETLAVLVGSDDDEDDDEEGSDDDGEGDDDVNTNKEEKIVNKVEVAGE